MIRTVFIVGIVVATGACAGAGQGRFASPVAPLAGCYALNFGPWPEEMGEDGARGLGLPSPEALPNVIELGTERVGRTDEAAVGGRIHEVRSHGRPGRGVLHYWRMVDSDSLVVSTGGPAGFRLEMSLAGEDVSGLVFAYSESAEGGEVQAPLSGVRAPCPRQAVPGA